jgi:hypothetical protein
LRSASEELQRRTQSLARAKALVEDKRTVLARLEAASASVERDAIEALKAVISNAPAAAADGPGMREILLAPLAQAAPVHAPGDGALTAQDAIQDAQHTLHLAQAAALEMAASLSPAETAVTRAQRAVSEAAVAVVIDRGLRLADLVAVAEREADRLRSALLGIDRPWIDGKPIKLPTKIVNALAGRIMGAGGWEAALAGLRADPEAPLP